MPIRTCAAAEGFGGRGIVSATIVSSARAAPDAENAIVEAVAEKRPSRHWFSRKGS
ncbi:Hypothetical protein A7982_04692 [Minicystis rosea]|nr:Hypothetical protein A7982_04692 [Minicystis rosea]